MTHAVVCPLCRGTGKLADYTDYGATGTYPAEKTCHGCGGKGWVEVSDK